MKVLSIVWYKVLPPKFGGQQGIALFNEALSRHVPLACLCTSDNDPATDPGYPVWPLLPTGKKQFLTPAAYRTIRDTVKRESISHIILEHPYHGLAAVRVARHLSCKLVLHAHNIESLRFRDLGKWWWLILYRYEKWVFRRADLCLFKTGVDRDLALKHFRIDAKKCMIVPYGINTPLMPDRESSSQLIRARHGIPENHRILLFAATLDYLPNARAVERIFTDIAPGLSGNDPGIKIIITGRNKYPAFRYLEQLSHPAVIYAGEQEDILPYFSAADALINPVDTGGGVQTKNIFALACHCNLVCFRNMIEKQTLALAPEKIFSAPPGDWAALIQQCRQALSGRPKTPGAFLSFYDWKLITGKLADRIREL